jgi:hypothetical protein
MSAAYIVSQKLCNWEEGGSPSQMRDAGSLDSDVTSRAKKGQIPKAPGRLTNKIILKKE